MPDIDIDFDTNERKRVINYIINKYGEEATSYISVYERFTPTTTIESISNLLDVPIQVSNFILSIIKSNKLNKIDDVLKIGECSRFYNEDPLFKEIIDISSLLSDVPKLRKIHPTGIIISNEDFINYSEFELNSKGDKQSLFTEHDLESLGFLKMDILPLAYLTFQKKMSLLIEKNYNLKINFYNLDINNKKTYDLLNLGLTQGIPHLNTPLNTSTVVNMKLNSLNDISLVMGINRPGPMKYKDSFLSIRKGFKKPNLYHPTIDKILSETYGIILFQEQVILIGNNYAGLTFSESDILLNAIKSKNEAAINKIQNAFFEGANKLNRPINTTKKIFEDIKEFCKYGFNKAHSIIYSHLAYEFAFLKANFPLEFCALTLNTSLDNRSLNELRYMNIKLLPPDLRYSDFTYKSVNGCLYMPLPLDSNQDIVRDLIQKSNYVFENFVSLSKDVLKRSDIETLIYSNAFDYTGYTKKAMIESLTGLLEFDTSLIKDMVFKVDDSKDEFDFDALRLKEYQAIKYNINYHPIKNVKGNFKRISECAINTNITVVAFITGIRETKTKNGDLMATMSVQDELSFVDAVMYPICYNSCRQFLKNNSLYEIKGSYSINPRDQKPQVKI